MIQNPGLNEVEQGLNAPPAHQAILSLSRFDKKFKPDPVALS